MQQFVICLKPGISLHARREMRQSDSLRRSALFPSLGLVTIQTVIVSYIKTEDACVTIDIYSLGVLSPSDVGRCFDADSDGYVRAEAIVVFILEKAKDAKRIYSEVVYAKVNCDGYKREGISYPSAKMQNVLMKELYAECGIDPTTLTFVEAHATGLSMLKIVKEIIFTLSRFIGTLVGDLEELEGLDDVMCTGRDRLLYIGSVKSNIGHSEAAAGLCSVTKVYQ